jgi:hypothetical protein
MPPWKCRSKKQRKIKSGSSTHAGELQEESMEVARYARSINQAEEALNAIKGMLNAIELQLQQAKDILAATEAMDVDIPSLYAPSLSPASVCTPSPSLSPSTTSDAVMMIKHPIIDIKAVQMSEIELQHILNP